MCVILVKPANIDIPEKTLKKCWKANPDGAGIMFSLDSKLFIAKGFMTFPTFLEYYTNLKNLNMVIHFRWASAGEIRPEQTHPFRINKRLGVCHNGTIQAIKIKKELIDSQDSKTQPSDTQLFVNNILKGLPTGFLNNESTIDLIKEYCYGSVMVFMDNRGEIKIVGEYNPQVVINGVWYSNDFWR